MRARIFVFCRVVHSRSEVGGWRQGVQQRNPHPTESQRQSVRLRVSRRARLFPVLASHALERHCHPGWECHYVRVSTWSNQVSSWSLVLQGLTYVDAPDESSPFCFPDQWSSYGCAKFYRFEETKNFGICDSHRERTCVCVFTSSRFPVSILSLALVRYYKEHSFNVKSKFECVEKEGNVRLASRWNNEEDCRSNGGTWTEFFNYLEKVSGKWLAQQPVGHLGERHKIFWNE